MTAATGSQHYCYYTHAIHEHLPRMNLQMSVQVKAILKKRKREEKLRLIGAAARVYL